MQYRASLKSNLEKKRKIQIIYPTPSHRSSSSPNLGEKISLPSVTKAPHSWITSVTHSWVVSVTHEWVAKGDHDRASSPPPTSTLAFSRLKALSSPAFIPYPSPPHSAFFLHPTKRREAPKPPPYSATGERFPAPLPSRSTDDRRATLHPAGRMSSPSRGEEDTPSLPLGSPHRSSSGKRLQLAPMSIDAYIP